MTLSHNILATALAIYSFVTIFLLVVAAYVAVIVVVMYVFSAVDFNVEAGVVFNW